MTAQRAGKRTPPDGTVAPQDRAPRQDRVPRQDRAQRRGRAPRRDRAPRPEPRSVLRSRDIVPLAALGMRARPARAMLSAAGVALGIATMVAVFGISSSSRAQLVAEIDALGTNLLTVTPASSFASPNAALPV